MENQTQWCFAWNEELPTDTGKSKGAILDESRWEPGETITVSFLDGDPTVQEKVRQVAQRWTAPGMANLTLEFRNNNDTDIRISFRHAGSWSVLGKNCRRITDRSRPTMNYGWLRPASPEQELQRVVLHEFGHALGFIHEHQNPINAIPWNRDAVIRDLSGPPNNWSLEVIERNMFQVPRLHEVIGTPFDMSSIMMYPIPASWTNGQLSVGLNNDLSSGDRTLVRQVYSS